MSQVYEDRQVVGVDLHRRRSVVVRTTPEGVPLSTVRIPNDPELLAAEVSKAGERADVVLEATYGWYWAADVLADVGARVHLAHPLGVKAFSYRRVKKTSGTPPTWRTCSGWAGCRRRGSLRRRSASSGRRSGTAPGWSRSVPA